MLSQGPVEAQKQAVRDAIAVFSLALLIRCVVFYLGNYRSLIGDESFYWYHAHQLVDGLYTHHIFLPGWPFLLSLPLHIVDSQVFARLWVILIGSSSVLFVYFIGRREFGRRVGLLAAFLFAFSPDQAFTSHYLYAEIIFEWLLLGLTYLVVREKGRYSRIERMCFLAFLFGVALLFKHFMVLAFTSFIFVLAINRYQSPKGLLTMLIFFFLVPALLPLRLASTGRDPLMPFNAPIQSIRAWQVNRISKGPGYTQRSSFVKDHVKGIFHKGAGYFGKRVYANILRLWGADSYPAKRLRWGKYGAWFPTSGALTAIFVFHVSIMFLGIVGLFAANNQPFKTFAWSNLVLLTLLSVGFLMVNRYRLPYMFFFILYAADALVNRRAVIEKIRLMAWPEKTGLSLLSLGFGWIVLATWPTYLFR